MKKRTVRTIKDVVDRCPKDGEPAFYTKCDKCQHKGTQYIVDKKHKEEEKCLSN